MDLLVNIIFYGIFALSYELAISHIILIISKKKIFDNISQFLPYIDFESNHNNDLPLNSIIDTLFEILHHSFSFFVPKIKTYNNYSLDWINTKRKDLMIKKKISDKYINFVTHLVII